MITDIYERKLWEKNIHLHFLNQYSTLRRIEANIYNVIILRELARSLALDIVTVS